MISAPQILALIPARGGSKSVPHKNIKLLAGKPLIQHSIEFSLASKRINRTVVSTDDPQIAAISERCGVEVIPRPAELATDQSLVIDAIRYTVDELERQGSHFDSIVLLEPTSPVRRMAFLEQCIDALEVPDVDCATTFCEAEVSPNRLRRIENGWAEPYLAGAIPWLPRQQQPTAYKPTGQVYAFRRAKLQQEGLDLFSGRIYPVLTPRDLAIDIDSEFDFLIAEQVLRSAKQCEA
jgi:CMP-N-acetylneuraminic acid synthetase